jgi:DNA-binding PadR family transcriptional regulator
MHRFHQHRGHHDHAAHGRHPFGWEGHGMRGLHRGHRERSERVFEQGDLRLLLLKLISEKPSHGYELIKAVEDSVGGAYSPSPGVVYPTLALLEDLGYTQVSEAEGGKKLFTITAEGTAFLETQAPALALLAARMEEATVNNRGRRSPQIVRAMENLRTALKLRLSAGPLNEAQLAAVAAALDAAAKAVEQA